MVVVIRDTKVYCDLCRSEIGRHALKGLGEFKGKRFYFTEGIFGKTRQADICEDCAHKIVLAAIKKEGERK